MSQPSFSSTLHGPVALPLKLLPLRASRRQLRAGLALALAAAALMGAGCGDDNNVGPDGGGTDGGMNNPPNPSGLGPKPIDLGASTDLTASGSYVLLAKTAITNVTGSLITGGHVGISPEVSGMITGFTLVPQVPDATTVSATSVSVASPGKIYASNYIAPTPTNLTVAVLDMQAAYTDAASRTNPDELNLLDGDLVSATLTPGLYTWGTGVTIPTDLTFSGAANDVWILQIASTLDVSADMSIVLAGEAQAKNIFWQVAGQTTIHENAHFEGIILSQTGVTLQTTASMKGRIYAQSMIAIDNNAITAP